VGAATMDAASTKRSSGRKPTRSTKRMRSKCLKVSPSALSIPSRNRSARYGSRASRCISWRSRRNVREADVSKVIADDGAEEAVRRPWEWTISRRMKCKYVSTPCCSASCRTSGFREEEINVDIQQRDIPSGFRSGCGHNSLR
jgi:hypothetical protein